MKYLAAYLPLALFAVCCASAPRPTPAPIVDGADQRARTVSVQVACDATGGGHWGSGVLVDGTHVVTAGHVVTCAKGAPVPRVLESAPSVLVVGELGQLRTAEVEWFSGARDLAVLVLNEAVPGVTRATVAEPALAGRVCLSAAEPVRRRSCGEVRALAYGVTDTGLYHGVPTIPGNSGSGVWDASGRLVGIATRCDTVSCKDPTGGYASMVVGVEW